MNVMNSERGSLNVLVIPLIMSVIFLFASLGFGVWAFAERQDYKDNSDAKAESAVAVAVEKAKTDKDNEFLEQEKQPLKSFTGPAEFGSITMQYPKTWAAYVDRQQANLTVSMQPDVVYAGQNQGLKVEVLSTAYAQSFAALDGFVRQGKASAAAYSFPQVPGVVGLRIDGEIGSNKRGAVVFMPLRDKTIKVSTESEDRLADFNNYILPNFQFKP